MLTWFSHHLYQRRLGISWCLAICLIIVDSAPLIGSSRGSRLNWSSCKSWASWPVHHKVVEETPPSLICTCELSDRVELPHAKVTYSTPWGSQRKKEEQRLESPQPPPEALNCSLAQGAPALGCQPSHSVTYLGGQFHARMLFTVSVTGSTPHRCPCIW
jgi:hypothetical protein